MRDTAIPNRPPQVSIVIPAYRSQETLARCLEAMLAQEAPLPGAPGDPAPGYEVVVVDSSPDEASAEVVRRYPQVHFVRSPERLLPHAARNAGAAVARGGLLVFTDPDIYPPAHWLRTLVAAHEGSGRPVVGSLACHGGRWLDVGIHLCKFSKWLPGGEPRPLDMMPTANLLVDRAVFDEVGGFDGDQMQGDVLFSWDLVARGHEPWFEPAAVVDHHHLTSFRDFLRERLRRGEEFAHLRAEREGHGRGRSLFFLAVSLLPVRLARIALLVAGHCRGAGMTGAMLSTLPVWLTGHAAWLLGESRGHLKRTLRRPAVRSGSGTGDHPRTPVAAPRRDVESVP